MTLRLRTIARLTGIREATLRAWERRYGFPRPHRGENNDRIYTHEEVENIRRVAHLIDDGLTVSEAISQFKSIFSAGAQYAESADEHIALWPQARGASNRT